MRFSPVGVIVLSVRIDTGGTEMHLGINNLRNGVIGVDLFSVQKVTI